MTRNESQTRQQLIDKRLLQAKWNVKDPSQVTEELDIWLGLPEGVREPTSSYEGHLFVDYALLGKEGTPLAVVEAKRTSKDARDGKEQARNYAQKIQEETTKTMPFVFYTNGHDIYYWNTEQYPPVKVYGFPTRSDLERIQFLRDNQKPLSVQMIDTNIAGRPYQIQAIRSVLQEVDQSKRKFLLVMATGTGKTRVCIGCVDALMRANRVQRVLFLVDRIALQNQALGAFKEFTPGLPLWPEQCETSFSLDRRVYVSTYPTILNIIEKDDCELSPFFFDLIIADESHRSIYNVYKNIFDYFHAVQLGLTATPTDRIDHNTFQLFNCDDGLPTFAYSYDEAIANKPPYLCDFEVLKIRTSFQKEGINSTTISDAEKDKLISEGKDPDEIDFEGTDLEKIVTNKGTNSLIVREFMEECIKDDHGVLPGKTIFFAATKKHAHRLCEAFDALYPEYKGQLAEVIVSDIRGVHGKGGLLDRFKNQDMPRVAISVDMLDTGIDILEIVNLVFAKPVFSYTKFWQMIGRGTRVLNENLIKPWCIKKDKFLIIDCWENFDYFKMKPKGKDVNNQIALPIRLFKARLDKLVSAKGKGLNDIIEKTKKNLKQDIQQLPSNSVPVLDNRSSLAKTEDVNFWIDLSQQKIEFLRDIIAPVMRALSGVDYRAMRFELDVVEYANENILQNNDRMDALSGVIIEKVEQLPFSVHIVAKERELIEKVLQPSFWYTVNDDDLDLLIEKLAPLMKFRETPTSEIVKLNIKDLLVRKEIVEFGPQHERLTIVKYREQLETFIRDLLNSNPVLQKLKNGEILTDNDIFELSCLLQEQYP
ncbi:MAG: DEAD/DEAH box helicase family protein, partial [Candidatus Omnitrophica bacterium]|nr:DEAD/DEAH box helicase family protein [Candidatus Omnitrophota bacterium]